LRRAIRRKLQDPLAERILSGSFAEGATLRVSVREGELKFE
jgi:ATP-dependent Clp protease ATP-binding subunit ClpA